MNPLLLLLGVAVILEVFNKSEKKMAQNLQNENESDNVKSNEPLEFLHDQPKMEEKPDDSTDNDGPDGCYDLRQTDQKVCVVPFNPGKEPEIKPEIEKEN